MYIILDYWILQIYNLDSSIDTKSYQLLRGREMHSPFNVLFQDQDKMMPPNAADEDPKETIVAAKNQNSGSDVIAAPPLNNWGSHELYLKRKSFDRVNLKNAEYSRVGKFFSRIHHVKQDW